MINWKGHRAFLYIIIKLKYMYCPFCKEKKLNRHLIFCKENKTNLSKIELRRFYLEYNYPDICSFDNLIENYITDKMSLPEILKKFNVDYNSIKFLLNYHNLPIRGYSDGAIHSMDKRAKTNMEKYGARNVLSKGTIKYDKRNKTVREKYGVDNVFQIPEIIKKINSDDIYLEKYNMTVSNFRRNITSKFWKSMDVNEKLKFIDKCNAKKLNTIMEKYGTDHPMKSDEVKEKIILTNLERYGVCHFFQSDEFLKNIKIQKDIKDKKIKNGHILSDFDIEPFLKYKRNCRKFTSRNKKILFENWDGNDYYDGEYIKDNFNLHQTDRNYPTIDHKISIFYGFVNDVQEEEISSLGNLCITKRHINSSKRTKSSESIKNIYK